MKGIYFLIGIVLSVFFATQANAEITFNRTPSGSEITSPVTIEVTISSSTDLTDNGWSTDPDLCMAVGTIDFWQEYQPRGSYASPPSQNIGTGTFSYTFDLPVGIPMEGVYISSGQDDGSCSLNYAGQFFYQPSPDYFEIISSSSGSSTSITRQTILFPVNFSTMPIQSLVCETATCTVNYATSSPVALTPGLIALVTFTAFLVIAIFAFIAYKFL